MAHPGVGLRVLLCLVAVSLILTGMPAGVLHAHAEGDHYHTHGVMPHVEEPPLAQDREAQAIVHFHEAASTAQALPDLHSPALLVPRLGAFHPPAVVTGLRVTSRPPPQRPPIA